MTLKETILGAKFADFGSELRQLSELIAIGMVFCYQNCSDLLREKNVLVIENIFLRSLEQFIQTVKVRNNF